MGASKSYAASEQLGAADFCIRPLADKFLHGGLVRVNAYKCAKFQVPSSISYRDMEGIHSQNTKWALLISPSGQILLQSHHGTPYQGFIQLLLLSYSIVQANSFIFR